MFFLSERQISNKNVFAALLQQEIATDIDVEAESLLEEEAGIIHNVLTQISRYQEDRQQNAGQKWKLPSNGQPICLFSGNTTATRTIIKPDDDIIFRVYAADHSFCTLRFPIGSNAETIKICAADKLQLNRTGDDVVLVEVKSNGERTVFKDSDVSIPTTLTLNGRLFVAPKGKENMLFCLLNYFRMLWESDRLHICFPFLSNIQ